MQGSQILKQCREYLKSYIILKELRDKEQAKLMPRAITYDKDRVQKSATNYQEQVAINLAVIENTIGSRLDKIVELKVKAADLINKVKPDQQVILSLYYLELKREPVGSYERIARYTFEDIARIIGYSESHTKKMCYEALKDIDKR